MKNRFSLFVLFVEIVAIVVLHSVKVNPDNSALNRKNNSPVKTDLATRPEHHRVLISGLNN